MKAWMGMFAFAGLVALMQAAPLHQKFAREITTRGRTVPPPVVVAAPAPTRPPVVTVQPEPPKRTIEQVIILYRLRELNALLIAEGLTWQGDGVGAARWLGISEAYSAAANELEAAR